MSRPCNYCSHKKCKECKCYRCNQSLCFATSPDECGYEARSLIKYREEPEEIPTVFDLTNISVPITSGIETESSPDALQGVANNFQLMPINDSRGEY